MKRIAAPCSLCCICLTVAGEAHMKPKRPGINEVTETINFLTKRSAELGEALSSPYKTGNDFASA